MPVLKKLNLFPKVSYIILENINRIWEDKNSE